MVDLYHKLLPESLAVADLGCSSGPTALMVVSEIVEAIGNTCRELGRRPPEIQFFLNDLPGNDFNNIFKSLPSFEKEMDERSGGEVHVPFYVVGVPGSFYERRFPKKSIHFMHSSYSLMWLSQVPPTLRSGSSAMLNKRNIYIAKTSPSSVHLSYLEQFQRDFSRFLKLRSEEIAGGGQMVLTSLARKNDDPSNGEYCHLWGLLADALNTMVLEGIVREEDLYTFNLPFYAPSMKELRKVIKDEGSFEQVQEYVFETSWDAYGDQNEDLKFVNALNGENVAKCIRAVTEPLTEHHFGKEISDELFSHYAKNVANHFLKEKPKLAYFVTSLKKKG